MNEEQNNRSEYNTLSSTEYFNKELLNLTIGNILLNSKSRNLEDKYAFCKRVEDLSILFEKFTPKKIRDETKEWYAQLEGEILKLQEDKGISPQQKEQMILDVRYRYNEEVHKQNGRILLKSPILKTHASATVIMGDEESIKKIRSEELLDDEESID